MNQQAQTGDNNAFTNVAVFTGTELAATQRQVEAPSALAAVEQQRSIAEIQAALVVAMSRPRNEMVCRDRLLRACQRSGLASVSVYQYPRGGTSVSGPSIRLAEAAARAYGNMLYGFREVARHDGSSECEAWAWDLETNTKAVRQFAVRHWRDTKKGGFQLKDERDIYELMANQAQRRVRAAILEIIPGDIIEDALTQCEATMKASIGGDIGKAVAGMKEAFGKFGITTAALEKRLGCRLESIQPAQIIGLRKIYASLNDGFSEPKDWFDMEPSPEATPAEPPATETPPPAPEQKTSPTAQAEPAAAATGKQSPKSGQARPAKQKTAPPQAEAQDPAEAGGTASATPPSLAHNPQTGEVFGPAAGLVTCPNSGQPVDELDCVHKSCRTSCPVFEF